MDTLTIIKDMRDLLRDSYTLSETYQELSLAPVLTALSIAAICGMVIYLVYRFFYRGIVYSENFNILLVLVTVATAFIINTISYNILLSLGMVGALSIVRFRTALKDPLDVGFLFCGIAAGVTAGAGLYFTAFVGTAFIALLYILLTIFKKEKRNYLLIIKYNAQAEDSVNSLLSKARYKLKNKIKTYENVELTIEIKVRNGDTDAVKKWSDVSGVEMVTLLEYSGEYMS